ncbi:DUF6542 domain-containing protein [Streptomyces sp. M19]
MSDTLTTSRSDHQVKGPARRGPVHQSTGRGARPRATGHRPSAVPARAQRPGRAGREPVPGGVGTRPPRHDYRSNTLPRSCEGRVHGRNLLVQPPTLVGWSTTARAPRAVRPPRSPVRRRTTPRARRAGRAGRAVSARADRRGSAAVRRSPASGAGQGRLGRCARARPAADRLRRRTAHQPRHAHHRLSRRAVVLRLPAVYGVLFLLASAACGLWVRPLDLIMAPISVPIAFVAGLVPINDGDAGFAGQTVGVFTSLSLHAGWLYAGTMLSSVIVIVRAPRRSTGVGDASFSGSGHPRPTIPALLSS